MCCSCFRVFVAAGQVDVEAPDMLTVRRAITVQWGECDPAGIVYFPRYFEWFDASTAALFEQAGLPKAVMLARYDSAGMAVVDVRSRFLKPSTFGDRVEIASSVAAFRRSSFDVEHKLFRGDDLAVE